MTKLKNLLHPLVAFAFLFTIALTSLNTHVKAQDDNTEIDEPVTKAKDWLCLFGGKKCFRTVYNIK